MYFFKSPLSAGEKQPGYKGKLPLEKGKFMYFKTGQGARNSSKRFTSKAIGQTSFTPDIYNLNTLIWKRESNCISVTHY